MRLQQRAYSRPDESQVAASKALERLSAWRIRVSAGERPRMAPSVEFRGQPFLPEDTAGDFLARTLADTSMTTVRMAVAWARFGGLARIEASVAALRERGGSAHALIGIDEGVATKPGLRKALAMFDKVHVIHDPEGRTFHPKLYLVEGPERAMLLVGSSNATAGGLYYNFEASLEAGFQLPEEQDEPSLVNARAYLEQLTADPAICVELTGETLEELLDDPRYPIAETERRARRRGGTTTDQDATTETDSAAGEINAHDLGEPLFNPSEKPRPPVPAISEQARRELDEIEAEADIATTDEDAEHVEAPAGVEAAPPTVVETWAKDLGHADAQQPVSANTNPIGNLRLTKSGHDIDHRTWFRQVLFGPAAWTNAEDSHGNAIEEAQIAVHVMIGGVDLGQMDLRVSHAPHREAGQGNVPTVLHWGPQLNALLRGTDYSGHVVRIERLDDGSYRLEVVP